MPTNSEGVIFEVTQWSLEDYSAYNSLERINRVGTARVIGWADSWTTSPAACAAWPAHAEYARRVIIEYLDQHFGPVRAPVNRMVARTRRRKGGDR